MTTKTPKTRPCNFATDDAGSFTIFALFTFVVMLIVGGMAVDFMRFEAERKRLQNTIDGAVLAASDLKQDLDSESVVRSHFEKAGYSRDDVQVTVNSDYINNGGTQELVSRSVNATSPLTVNTILMPTLGIEELTTVAAGEAFESRQNVEISLVLDISGTMRYGAGNSQNNTDNRIMRLRTAVTDFVDIVLQVNCDSSGLNCIQSPNTETTTINVIPYAGSVNPGQRLFELMGGDEWHKWSYCMEVTDADFDHMGLPGASSDQLPHFMKWRVDWTWMNWGWCPKEDSEILIAENDAQVIKDYINAMKLHDGTATHIGMKYGTALLNPDTQPIFDELATRGEIDSAYKDRPLPFQEGTVKYLILMTDGQTTTQFRPDNFNYSVVYMDPAARTPDQQAEFDAIMDAYGSEDSDGNLNPASWVERDDNSGSDDNYVAGTQYKDASGKTHNGSTNNGHILAMCDEAKKKALNPDGTTLREDRITVFTVAFLAPSGAIDNMQKCASTESHFYNVQDLSIGDAFASIARTINQLRLTQ